MEVIKIEVSICFYFFSWSIDYQVFSLYFPALSLTYKTRSRCIVEMFISVFFRIWRTRCTLPSRGDARCWRISTTPKASAKHQHPLTFASSCSHSSVHSHCFASLSLLICSTPSALTPVYAFFFFSSPLWRCRVTEWHECNPSPPPRFAPRHMFLASERHFPCGFTCCSFSCLITEGKFWGFGHTSTSTG